MTLPRRLVPGQTHSTTRRCSSRVFGLTPSEFVNDVMAFTLGVALERADVRVHAVMCMSNHEHGHLTDGADRSEMSVFFREWHALSGKAFLAEYGQGENFWRTGSFDNVENHGRLTIEEQLLYIWTNPVRAGQVATPEEWPGFKYLPEDFGHTFTYEKPEGAFFNGRRPAPRSPDEPTPRRSRSKLPARVTVTVHPPPGYEGWPIEEVRRHFRRLLNAEVARIHEDRRARGLPEPAGAAAVLSQDPTTTAGSARPTFARNPRIACTGDREAFVTLLRGLQAWRAEYREAWGHWRAGRRRRAVFPWGSYLMPTLHRAQVRAPPPAA